MLIDGQRREVEGQGDGPVHAFVAALAQLCGTPVQVLDYHEHAIGAGASARAAAYFEMRVGEHKLFGVGLDADIVAASFKALLSGARRAGALQLAEPTAVRRAA
jgi:2-isopropylmalate synthase